MEPQKAEHFHGRQLCPHRPTPPGRPPSHSCLLPGTLWWPWACQAGQEPSHRHVGRAGCQSHQAGPLGRLRVPVTHLSAMLVAVGEQCSELSAGCWGLGGPGRQLRSLLWAGLGLGWAAGDVCPCECPARGRQGAPMFSGRVGLIPAPDLGRCRHPGARGTWEAKGLLGWQLVAGDRPRA